MQATDVSIHNMMVSDPAYSFDRYSSTFDDFLGFGGQYRDVIGSNYQLRVFFWNVLSARHQIPFLTKPSLWDHPRAHLYRENVLRD